MKPIHLITVFSVAAIALSVIASGAAQACPFSSQLTSANSASQSPLNISPTTTNHANLAGFTLLSSLLAVSGIYWSRRSRQSNSVIDRSEYEALEMLDTPVLEQGEERLVSSRQ